LVAAEKAQEIGPIVEQTLCSAPRRGSIKQAKVTIPKTANGSERAPDRWLKSKNLTEGREQHEAGDQNSPNSLLVDGPNAPNDNTISDNHLNRPSINDHEL
jgi:hypothetical protein